MKFDERYFKGEFGSSYFDYHVIGQSAYILTIKILRKFISMEGISPSKYSILVIGCAYGYEAKAAFDLGFKEVVGSDISPHAIGEAKNAFPQIKFVVDDITHSKFPDRSFDIVMANNVLEHIPNPQDAIREMKRISRKYVLLRQDNVFVIELYNSLPLFLRKVISKIKKLPEVLDTDLTHISQLPRYKWVQLIEAIGLKVKRIYSLSNLPLLLSGFHCYVCVVE